MSQSEFLKEVLSWLKETNVIIESLSATATKIYFFYSNQISKLHHPNSSCANNSRSSTLNEIGLILRNFEKTEDFLDQS